jgi:hypothetical protein
MLSRYSDESSLSILPGGIAIASPAVAAAAGSGGSKMSMGSEAVTMNKWCGHPLLKESDRPDIQKKITKTLLLRFYPAARRNFARHYQDVLEKGYAELKRPMPPYGTLSRKAALEAIGYLSFPKADFGPALDWRGVRGPSLAVPAVGFRCVNR